MIMAAFQPIAFLANERATKKSNGGAIITTASDDGGIHFRVSMLGVYLYCTIHTALRSWVQSYVLTCTFTSRLRSIHDSPGLRSAPTYIMDDTLTLHNTRKASNLSIHDRSTAEVGSRL